MNILDYYDYVKDNCVAVYKTGSTILKYLKNCRDIDYMFLYDTEEHAQEAKKKFFNKYDRFKLHDNKIDIHFRSTEEFKDIWGFAREMEIIFDNINYMNSILSILEDKKEFINKIKYHVIMRKERCLKNKKLNFYKIKGWYYTYRIHSILKNNSYELTEEQKENINILHDMREEDLEKRKELIDNLVKEIESWQN